MIGISIRSYRHLVRSVGNKPTKILMYNNQGVFINGEAIKLTYSNNSTKRYVCLFQNFYNMNSVSDIYKNCEKNLYIDELSRKYSNCAIMSRAGMLENLNSKVIVLPEDFDKQYLDFYKNNRKLLEPLFEKYGLIDNDSQSIPLYFFCLCHNSPNLFLWALKNYYGNRINLNYIVRVLTWNNNYNQLVNKLEKGTIQAYNNREQIIYLLGEMRILRRNKRANDMINLFNTNQKKLLKGLTLSEHQYEILGKFGRISNTKQHNFVRKMSTIDNVDEIFRQMAFLVDIHFEWSKASLLEYVHHTDGLNCEIVIEGDTYVLLKVNNYDTIKKVAKNTNWCISKNKRYWSDYIDNKCGDAIQYIICDFTKNEDDKLSMVGFTINRNRGITNAHNFVNDNLMSDNSMMVNQLTPIVNDNNSIDGLLKNLQIPLNKIIPMDEIDYEWKRDSFIEYLHTCVNEDNVIIYYNDNNKMVLSINDEGVRYLFNETYSEMFSSNQQNHFIFVDFNKSIEEVDRIKFCLIYDNLEDKESSASEVYGINCKSCSDTFESLLEEYDLPYDIIPRIDNTVNRFMSAFRGYDLKTVKKLIGNEDVRKHMMNINDNTSDNIYSIVNWTLNSYGSLDYLTTIYESGLTLSLIMTPKYLSSLTHNIIRRIFNGRMSSKTSINPFSDDIIKNYYENNIKNGEMKLFVGLSLALKMIMENEPFKVFYHNIGIRLTDIPACPLMAYIMERAVDTIDFNREDDISTKFMRMTAATNNTYIIEKICNMDIKNYNVLNMLVSNMRGADNNYRILLEKVAVLRDALPKQTKKTSTKNGKKIQLCDVMKAST